MSIIKVGFGPRTTANSYQQSGVKVAQKLREDPNFQCNTFFSEFKLKELMEFDVLIFIKILPSYEKLKKLKEAGKILILDYQDMFLFPTAHETNYLKKIAKHFYYFKHERHEKRKLSCIDLCFVASPESFRVAESAGLTPYFLFRQIYNDSHEKTFKQHSNETNNLKIIWTGVELNLPHNKEIETILQELCKKYSCEVVYLTQSESYRKDYIQSKIWTLETWENDLLEGDIAFRWWQDSNDQRHKDSNKIISYMAAGLPVVCKPTTSDRRVIKDGETGFFATDPQEFKRLVENLILNPDVRKKVGQSAYTDVWSKYSLENHVSEIKTVLRTLIEDNCNDRIK